jgi:hypothetical protein
MQTRPSHPHKNKRNDPLLRNIWKRWQNALNTITNILEQVSVPVENGSQQSTIFKHVLRGSSTFVPTHAPSGPEISYLIQVLQAKHKQQKKASTSPNSSTKATNNQNKLYNQEKKANTPKSQYTFVKAIPQLHKRTIKLACHLKRLL